MTDRAFDVIDNSDVRPYPDELCDPQLTADFFTKFWHDRWLGSRLHLTGDLAVQGAALNLFFYSRKQVPVGSLPREEAMLARLLRVDLQVWRGLMAQSPNPLHNWSLYSYGETVVYGHEVVIEVLRDALSRREERQRSNDEKAVRQRRFRLVEVMRGMQCVEAMWTDDILVARLDDWLVENHRGQRRMPQFEASVRRALAHATQIGWINAP